MRFQVEFKSRDGSVRIERIEVEGRRTIDFMASNAQGFLQLCKFVYDQAGEHRGMALGLPGSAIQFNYADGRLVTVREAVDDSAAEYRMLPRVVLPFQITVPAGILKTAGTDANCKHSFAELVGVVLPRYMAELRSRMAAPCSMADFALDGVGVRTLLQRFHLEDDFSGSRVGAGQRVRVTRIRPLSAGVNSRKAAGTQQPEDGARSGHPSDRVKAPEPFADLVPTREREVRDAGPRHSPLRDRQE